MRELPSGTVTFLFTDIEGSTLLLRELGDAYAETLLEHRRALRAAFARHDGVEVDTQGDAFFVAFGRAADGVAAACEAQRSLDGSPVNVRMGLHTGTPLLTREGYVGLDVHRGARIAAAAHGGQIVASATTREASGRSFRDLGTHGLKDFDEPVRLYQVNEGKFPALRALNVSNLPSPASPLIGRSNEVSEVVALCARSRLVTLTGPGGTGKTRLGLQVAAELVDRFRDGVFWVPLAPLADHELVVPTIAQTLGAKTELRDHIADKAMLLLLDNFEQVVAAAENVAALLEICPRLTVLVTSRAPLRVAGELEYSVEPLTVEAAVSLFRERATVAEPVAAVHAICRRLDCLPLAIELAAARTRVLPPELLLERLVTALPVLTSGRRDAPERQSTLRATIEWSFLLLSPPLRRLFARLSVFVDGFEIAAAEEICAASLDDLEALVEQSLVQRWQHGRLAMLQTIREFSTEQLVASGEADAVRGRHADYFAELATALRASLWDASHDEAARSFSVEQDNVRAALDWARAAHEPELLLRLAIAAAEWWMIRGSFDEGRGWLEAALATDEMLPQAPEAQALASASALEHAQGAYEQARRHAEAAVALERSLDDRVRLSHALNRLGNATKALGEVDAARALYDEALSVSRESGDRRGSAVSLINLGVIDVETGQFAAAEQACREASELFRTLGNRSGFAAALVRLGAAALAQERADDASSAFAEALRIYWELDRHARMAECLSALATVAERKGDPGRASVLLAATEVLREETGTSPTPYEQLAEDRLRSSLRDELSAEALARTRDTGRELELDAVVAKALAGIASAAK